MSKRILHLKLQGERFAVEQSVVYESTLDWTQIVEDAVDELNHKLSVCEQELSDKPVKPAGDPYRYSRHIRHTRL